MAVSREAWASKLSDMEHWYQDLLADREAADASLAREYAPHVAFLATLEGRVLDVGGGAGPTARYLQPSCRYVVVDPSALWTSREWQSFGAAFRGGDVVPEHIVGVGEDLPFPDASFDAVVSMWSLNHAQDWRRCIAEMARVARPGGRILLVLEDMEPGWPDVARAVSQRIRRRLGLATRFDHFHNERIGSRLTDVLRGKLRRGWPVQDDHILIEGPALAHEARTHLSLTRREWKDGFLTLEYARC